MQPSYRSGFCIGNPEPDKACVAYTVDDRRRKQAKRALLPAIHLTQLPYKNPSAVLSHKWAPSRSALKLWNKQPEQLKLNSRQTELSISSRSGSCSSSCCHRSGSPPMLKLAAAIATAPAPAGTRLPLHRHSSGWRSCPTQVDCPSAVFRSYFMHRSASWPSNRSRLPGCSRKLMWQTRSSRSCPICCKLRRLMLSASSFSWIARLTLPSRVLPRSVRHFAPSWHGQMNDMSLAGC